jgi:CubicO group peptidase (beta-lactamase class C family)
MSKSLYVILLLLISSSTWCQSIKTIDHISQLTDSIRAVVQARHIPGLMLGIASRDSVLFSGGFGYADVQAKRPVTGQTLFRMGSITKMFVSLGMLQLVKEGKIKLTDELKKVAPEIPFQNDWETAAPVRIVHLLEHTAGFDDMKLNRMCTQEKVEYPDSVMMLLQQPSLVCRWKPGERFAYSNPGYVLLGYIIRKLTGKPYDQYITEQVLRPLGMSHSNFNTFSKFPLQDVKQYVVHGAQIKEVPSVTILMPPAGSLWSCSDDMIQFLRLFLNHGAPLFNDQLITEMETVHSPLSAKAGLTSGYGLGNNDLLFYNQYAWRGHRGLMGTCHSSFMYNRELGLGFVLSSNGNQRHDAIEKLIADFLEQGKPAPQHRSVALDIKAVTPFVGQYRFESPRNEIAGFKDRLLETPKLYIKNNTLYIKPLLGGHIRLIPVTPLSFAMEGANTATVVLIQQEGKNIAIIYGGYFEQVSAASVRARFWLSLVAVSIIVVASLAGLFSLIVCLAGKLSWKKLPVRILPLIALGLLVWALLNLLQVQEESYLLSELGTINARTIIIFCGTLLFGILSLLHLWIAVRKMQVSKNYWLASWWLLTALSLCYLSGMLLLNGWIGMRTWAM